MNANGLIMVAHSKTVAAALARLFQGREIEKRYKAIVEGDFSVHEEPLRIELPVNDKASASIATFEALSADGTRSLVDVEIETGRKHQIRRHLAESGFPIVGDRLYGNGVEGGEDMQLTAYLLAFECPVTDQHVEYRLPDEWMPTI